MEKNIEFKEKAKLFHPRSNILKHCATAFLIGGGISLIGEIMANIIIYLGINEKDSIEIFTDNDKIILQKYQPACTFCSNANNIIYFGGKRVCADCIEKLKNQL